MQADKPPLDLSNGWRGAASHPTHPQRLMHLDGLRGIAAIGVILYHTHNVFGLKLGFGRGYLFVDLFFMLSGFVLSLAWTSDFARGTSAQTLVRGRIRRLWPTMAAASLLAALIHYFLGDVQHVGALLLLALLFVPFIGQSGPLYPLNGPQWSIVWELFANIMHILWLSRISLRGLWMIALIMGVGLCVATVITGTNSFGPDGDTGTLAITRVGWSYTIGIIFAQLYHRAALRRMIPWWLSLMLITIAVVILPLIPLPLAVGDIVMVIVVFPGLFWLTVTTQQPIRMVGALAKLGALSFPLYATHSAILVCFASLALPRALAAPLAIGTALLFSAIFIRASARLKRGLGRRSKHAKGITGISTAVGVEPR